MKTKADLASFLRARSEGDVVVPHGTIVEIFHDHAVAVGTVNAWLKSNGLNYESNFSHSTAAQWIFAAKLNPNGPPPTPLRTPKTRG